VKKLAVRFFVGLLIVLALVAGAGFVVYDRVLPAKFTEAGRFEQDVLVMIVPGSGINVIANQLAGLGLIEHGLLFRIKSQLAGEATRLQAGEYLIPSRASLDDIFAMMRTGAVLQHAITIAEGLTSQMIAQSLAANELLTGNIDVIPPEGSLLPETFHVVRGTSRNALLGRMQRDQSNLLAALWAERAPDLPFSTQQQALVLASIVEKEAGQSKEQQRVAAVFVNRLRKGMRLESDPTIIYGLSGGQPLGRGLRRSEIDRKTAWNTYQIDGLPPTPICNPGAAAIYAVLHPAQSEELFFVADGAGGHRFAKTYAGHLVNVAKWRKVERDRKRASRN